MVAFVVSLLIAVVLVALIFPMAKRRPVGTPAHLGRGDGRRRVYVFFIMFWVYGVVPHLWLTWADNELELAPGQALSYGPVVTSSSRRSIGGWFPITLNDQAIRDIIVVVIYVVFLGLQHVPVGLVAEPGQARRGQAPAVVTSDYGRPLVREGLTMARTDANPPMPEFRDDYVLQEVDADWLSKAVKPKQFIHIDQSECIMCEGCVDICPWKCIHMVRPDAIDEAVGTERPGVDPGDHVDLH